MSIRPVCIKDGGLCGGVGGYCDECPNSKIFDTMLASENSAQAAITAGDGTLHGAIDYWQVEAERLRAELAACRASHAVLEGQVSDMAQRLLSKSRKGVEVS